MPTTSGSVTNPRIADVVVALVDPLLLVHFLANDAGDVKPRTSESQEKNTAIKVSSSYVVFSCIWISHERSSFLRCDNTAAGVNHRRRGERAAWYWLIGRGSGRAWSPRCRLEWQLYTLRDSHCGVC